MAVTGGSLGDEGLPERIGPYRIRRRIGQGGMGVVYQALDSADNFVAIKVLKPEVAGDTVARARLAREVETMRRVHSPNVAEVIDADTEAPQPWVVTEYVPGPTLDATVTDHGPLRGRALSRFTTGLARALEAIHAAGVIHRDLKPGNVIISNGEPIVIDFGIAHAVDMSKLTQTGTFVGTPSYLSPEVIEGTDLSSATDIHAWGATVSFSATGRAPYGAGAFEVIFFRILNGEIDVDGMPEELKPLVSRAVSRDLSQRPTAGQLIGELGRINLDLPLADNAQFMLSGLTGSHTVQRGQVPGGQVAGSRRRPDATGQHVPAPTPPPPPDPQATMAAGAEAPPTGLLPAEESAPRRSDDPHGTMAAAAGGVDRTMAVPPGGGADQTMVGGGTDQTMAAGSGGVDQTMVGAPGDPQSTGLLPSESPAGVADNDPGTQFFNSPINPDEFRDMFTPVQDKRGRGGGGETAMFEAETREDGENYYQPYYDPDFEADQPKRFPSLILIPLLLILVGFTQMLPTVGLIIGVLVATVLSALDTVKSEHARRLMERGPSNTDHVVIALSFPWAFVRRLGSVLMYGGMYLLGGLFLGLIIGFTFGESTGLYIGAYAISLMMLMLYLIPYKGEPIRRQSVWLVSKIGISNPYVYWGTIVAVCLAALFFVVFGIEQAPDWRPLALPGWMT